MQGKPDFKVAGILTKAEEEIIPIEQPFFHLQQALEETADEVIHRDEKGIVKRDKKDVSSMPEFLDYPVKCWDDWEKLKRERFNPDSTERFPADWENQVESFNKSNHPIWLGYFPYGIFGTPRDLLGAEELLVSFHTRRSLRSKLLNVANRIGQGYDELPMLIFGFAFTKKSQRT